MLSDQYFSYSGPTSMGKSFIMRMFIKQQILEKKRENYAIIVPTKALINEVSDKIIKDDLKEMLEEYNYRVVTAGGDIALKQSHNFIFVMTPERFLYYLIDNPTKTIAYLFIDEAKKAKGDLSTIEKEIVTIQQEQKDNKENRKKTLKELEYLHKIIAEEVKPSIKKKFDYEIPIAKIDDAGITTTGAASEGNQLPALVEEYREYCKGKQLWDVRINNYQYYSKEGVFYRSDTKQEVRLNA